MEMIGWVTETVIWIRSDNTGRIDVDACLEWPVRARVCPGTVTAELRYDQPGCVETIITADSIADGIAKFTIPRETLPTGWVCLRVIAKDVSNNIVDRSLKHQIRVEECNG